MPPSPPLKGPWPRPSTREAPLPRVLKRQAVRQFYREVVETFALESFHLRLLTESCLALQRSMEAREQVNKDGLTYTDNAGRRYNHPSVSVEMNARAQFFRGIRELGLDLEADSQALLPSRQGSRRK